MMFMSVEVPERFVKRLSKLKGRESEEGRDKYSLKYKNYQFNHFKS